MELVSQSLQMNKRWRTSVRRLPNWRATHGECRRLHPGSKAVPRKTQVREHRSGRRTLVEVSLKEGQSRVSGNRSQFGHTAIDAGIEDSAPKNR